MNDEIMCPIVYINNIAVNITCPFFFSATIKEYKNNTKSSTNLDIVKTILNLVSIKK
jgi:hypothetical protein